MLNVEKYEEEIKKQIVKSRDIPCIARELRDGDSGCGECRNCVTCSLEMLHWLSQEYKEPILTDKEKAYLKNVIEPLNVVVDYIRKCENYTSENNIFYTVVVRVKHSEIFACSYVLIDFVVTKDMPFEGMELKKRYTREELGL